MCILIYFSCKYLLFDWKTNQKHLKIVYQAMSMNFSMMTKVIYGHLVIFKNVQAHTY